MRPPRFNCLNALLLLVLAAAEALAAGSLAPPELSARRTSGHIAVDGELLDGGWKGAYRVNRVFGPDFHRALADTDTLEPSSRQFFAKVSYAFQR